MISSIATVVILIFMLIVFDTSGEGCTFEPALRDKWFFANERKSTFFRIRESTVIYQESRVDRIRYTCTERVGNGYLLKKRGFTRGRSSVLCIGFSGIVRGEYSVTRLNEYGLGPSLFSPSIARNEMITFNTTCNHRLENKRIRRQRPGCRFPSGLRGEWNFTFHRALKLIVDMRNWTIIMVSGDPSLILECHRRDGNIYLLRSRGPTPSNTNMMLCLRITELGSDPYYDYQLSRLNSANGPDGYFRIIPKSQRVHIHQDCDWIDSPSRPEFLYS